MENLWFVLAVLLTADAAHSHRDSQGLSCVNDLVSNVSCTWNGSAAAPGATCWVAGARETRILKNNKKRRTQMIRTCRLEQHGNSPPGCSFVFENKEFNCFKDMPYISLECNGTLVENLTNYKPCNHIKMHPPGVPNVSASANQTWIWWTAGSPLSIFLKAFVFQIQIKRKTQAWKEARTLFTQELMQKLPSLELQGHCQVRVRVCPTQRPNSHWSDWSPTTSWIGPTEPVAASPDQEAPLFIWTGVFSFSLVVIVTLILYGRRVSKGLNKEKSVPNPSKYFHTLHSVHRGNLKTWLNPLSAPASFFTAQPCDHISTVELCDGSDGVTSTSPSSSSTSALLHFQSYPSTRSDTSGVVDDCSSSSSSFFSNMGYFLSSSFSSSARTDPSHSSFTYQEDLLNQRHLHRSFWPSFTTATPIYESLNKEPRSPNPGFDIGKEDENDKKGKMIADAEVLHHRETLTVVPLHSPSEMFPSCPPPSDAPSRTQVSSDRHQVAAPAAAASGSYAAWPLAGAMCRSSSMPVEPSKAGYLSLKELQTTFSNKSI
ncbi:interleukin-2 receptor subunit beta [Brachionichthys hirsutus]|uniref:interleukin-2 receptor subunit beta n=1 Tax=Brachionichthys hirsutus TaxID=412623 RepID=UPI0036052722